MARTRLGRTSRAPPRPRPPATPAPRQRRSPCAVAARARDPFPPSRSPLRAAPSTYLLCKEGRSGSSSPGSFGSAPGTSSGAGRGLRVGPRSPRLSTGGWATRKATTRCPAAAAGAAAVGGSRGPRARRRAWGWCLAWTSRTRPSAWPPWGWCARPHSRRPAWGLCCARRCAGPRCCRRRPRGLRRHHSSRRCCRRRRRCSAWGCHVAAAAASAGTEPSPSWAAGGSRIPRPWRPHRPRGSRPAWGTHCASPAGTWSPPSPVTGRDVGFCCCWVAGGGFSRPDRRPPRPGDEAGVRGAGGARAATGSNEVVQPPPPLPLLLINNSVSSTAPAPRERPLVQRQPRSSRSTAPIGCEQLGSRAPGALESLGLRGDRLLFKEKETRPPGGRRSGGNRLSVCVGCARACECTRECTRVRARLATRIFPFPLGGALGTQILEYCQRECPEAKLSPGMSEVFPPKLPSLPQY